MKRFLLFIGLFSLTLCGFSQQVRETLTGLRYIIHEDSLGRKGKLGDLATIHMIMKSDKGEVLKNTYPSGKPLLFPIKYPAFEGDLYEGMTLLSDGDSATMWVSADSMYQKVFKQPLPENVGQGSLLTFNIKVFKVRSQEDYLEEQKEHYDQYKKESPEAAARRQKEEDKQIQAFVEQSGMPYKKTKSGVYYVTLKEGDSDKYPKKGQTVGFHFQGYLLDGKEFENSYAMGRPVYFPLGSGSVIQGWEDVFPKLEVGSTVQMVVPSHLAYGNIPKDKIPANSILMFVVEIIDIRE